MVSHKRITNAPPPIFTVGGHGSIRRPKPTEVLSNLPVGYPRTLVARTFVIVGEGVRKFPVQTQTLELCKYVISELTPHFREAWRDKVLGQDQALSSMHDLLHYVLVHNSDDGKRYELQKEVLKSDEWLALAKAIAGETDNDVPINADSIQQTQGTRGLLGLTLPDSPPEDQVAETSELSLTVCAVCGHYEACHDHTGCFLDPHGKSLKDPGILSHSVLKKTGALCWCPRFLKDFAQAAELIYESGNCDALKRGTVEALSRRDFQNARRLLDGLVIKTTTETRDQDWIRATERIIDRLRTDAGLGPIGNPKAQALPVENRVSLGRVAQQPDSANENPADLDIEPELRPKPKPAAVVDPDVKLRDAAKFPTMTVQEVMAHLRISRASVYRYINEGRLNRPGLNKKPGKRSKTLILTRSVQKMLQEAED